MERDRGQEVPWYAKAAVPVPIALVLLIVAPAWGALFLVFLVMWLLLTFLDARVAFVFWLVFAGLSGFGTWFGYVWHASDEGAVPTCGSDPGFLFGPSWSGGGQASSGSNATAAAIGIVLLLAGGVVAWRFRRQFVLLLVGYLVLYLAALVGLWYIAPHIWGARYC
jgi:hypothetical protein